MSYQLTLEKFQGPLSKLLSLIEERELQITEVSLGKVTDDFLQYLGTLQEVPPGVLADFVSVASRLILIKSKVLLPDLTLTEEEETQIHELERRLAFYKVWKEAEKTVAAAFGNQRLYSRPYLSSVSAAFYPAPGLTLQALGQALEGVVQSLASFTREKETLKETIIAIEEKIAEILARVTAGTSTSFRAVAGSKHIKEVVALFLAVLHLAREGRVHLEQAENFSDIMVTHRGAENSPPKADPPPAEK